MSDAIDKLQDLWFAWDQGSMIGMADTINAIRPALDEMAEARAEIARLTAELAAARAVPADVEAALSGAWADGYDEGRADALRRPEDHHRKKPSTRDATIAWGKAAIARAISDATAAHGTVGGLLATAPRPQCPTHGDTVSCYCTTGALHCHDCGHTPPFCTACDGYHDAGPCPLPKGG